MRHSLRISVVALPIVLAASTAGAANTLDQNETDGLAGVYSFIGALEGDATLFAARSGGRSELELHLPILRGDRIRTTWNARLAALMSDRSILALDHDSEMTLERIAGSPDGEDRDSLYVLHRGRLSLEIEGRVLEPDLPIVDTANARVYLKRHGRYQIRSDGSRWTEATVLTGFAEVVTQRGSAIVRTGETLVADGLDNPRIELQGGSGAAAAALDDWTAGHRASLLAYAAVDAGGYRDTLGAHGEWVEVDDRRAWKPTVERNWQPYSRGRWTDTPAGLYWVARDPWGPITYHYGSWNRHPAWGWIWYPGLAYAPSHVYWYWGPSYVGWIPRGYYQHYYRGLGLGLRFGLYGWAGGYWDSFDTWIFCPTGYLGYGRGYAYGHSLRRRHPRLERGIITTDTRGIDRRNWRDPAATRQVLIGWRRGLDESEIPNADSFVARVPDLDPSFGGEIGGSDDPAVGAVPGARPPEDDSGLRSVTAGGLRAPPSGRPARDAAVPDDDVDVGIGRFAPIARNRDDEAAKPGMSVEDVAPAAPGAAPLPGRRPPAGRRVLDAIRRRDGDSLPTRLRSEPRTTTPREAPPTRLRSEPRTTTPREAPPKQLRSEPRTTTPREAPPKRLRSEPRTTTPREAPPKRLRSEPRTTPPREAPPKRLRAAPGSSSPRSPAPTSSPPVGGRKPPLLP